MQNNQWKIMGDELPTKSFIELKDSSITSKLSRLHKKTGFSCKPMTNINYRSNTKYVPVSKFTRMGAPDIGQARQREGWTVPGWSRACRAVCCNVIEPIFVPFPTSHSASVFSVSAARRR